MIWNKLKKTVERLLADSLQGRIEFHITRYGPGVSYMMNRGWVTFDKQEILSSSTIKWIREHFKLTEKWVSRDPQIAEQLRREQIYTRDEFIEALEDYVQCPINDVLTSSNPFLRAFAMLDRRVGKRRLKEMTFREDEYQIVKEFYRIRCQAEGITNADRSEIDPLDVQEKA